MVHEALMKDDYGVPSRGISRRRGDILEFLKEHYDVCMLETSGKLKKILSYGMKHGIYCQPHAGAYALKHPDEVDEQQVVEDAQKEDNGAQDTNEVALLDTDEVSRRFIKNVRAQPRSRSGKRAPPGEKKREKADKLQESNDTVTADIPEEDGVVAKRNPGRPPKKKKMLGRTAVKRLRLSEAMLFLSRPAKRSSDDAEGTSAKRRCLREDEDEDDAECASCEVTSGLPLITCVLCTLNFHMRCVQAPPRLLDRARAHWHCPTCKKCDVCKSAEDAESMVMCDTCDGGFHLQCLSPPLPEIPAGSWNCVDCDSGRSRRLGAMRNRSETAAPEVPHSTALLFVSPTPSLGGHGPFKLEKMHHTPNIYLIENFLSKKQCTELMKRVKVNRRKFKRSFVDSAESEKSLTEERTSSNLFFEKQQDSFIRTLEMKAADLLCMPMENVEPLQLVAYRDGQRFNMHHDAGTLCPDGSIDIVPPRRLFTIFCYLNTLPEGIGHTDFPSIDLSVRPVERRAVLWCNFDLETGEIDPRAVHRACPVPSPHEKFGLNIWITDRNVTPP